MSIYCTLFLLDCFDFSCGCICIYVYSVTLFIVVINLCLYIGLLQFWRVFLFLFSFLFFNFNLKIFKPIIIFSTFIPLFAFPTVLFPLQLIFIVCKFSLSSSIYLCISILSSFSFFPFLSMYLLVLFPLVYSPLGTLL